MSIFESIILGIVQGLTEFLPISSSGHLVLFQKLFNLRDVEATALFFDTMVHLGTLIAVFAVFRKDIIEMIKKPFSKLSLLVIAGTIPTVIVALLLKGPIEVAFKSGSTLGLEFIITGLILWYAERKRYGHKKVNDVSYIDAVFIGLLQGLAIFPAISRSGSTIAGALMRGIERETAARYSFLLSIPAILGAVILQTKDVIESNSTQNIEVIPVVVGTIVAGISGYIAIKFMLKLIAKGSLKFFAYYVWILGSVIIAAQLLGKF
jgi:undecaprenyl-diphosphatase